MPPRAPPLIGAGLLSVLLFPVGGLALLRRDPASTPRGPDTEPARLMAM